MDIANLQVTVESAPAIRSLGDLDKAFNNTTKSVNKTSDAIDALNTALGKITTTKIDALIADLDKLGKSVDAFNKFDKQIRNAATSLSGVGKSVDKLNTSLNSLNSNALGNVAQQINSIGSASPALNNLSSGLDGISKSSNALGKSASGLENFINNFLSLRSIGAKIGSLLAIEFLLKELYDFVKQFFQAAADIEGMVTKVNAATGEMGMNAGISFDYVKAKANELGISVKIASDTFAGIAAATKDTGMEGAATTEIWTKMTEIGTVLGQSNEQLSGSLKAIGQMLSKQSVNAEELKGQLGDRVPMAIRAAAQAFADMTGVMGTSADKTKALFKAMEEGKVPVEVVLGLVRNMHNEISGGLNDALASNRMALIQFQTAWENLTIAIGQAFALDWAAKVARDYTKLFDTISFSLKDSTFLFKNLSEVQEKYNELFPGLTASISMLKEGFIGLSASVNTLEIGEKFASPLLSIRAGIIEIVALLDFMKNKLSIFAWETVNGTVESITNNIDTLKAKLEELKKESAINPMANVGVRIGGSFLLEPYDKRKQLESEINELVKKREELINKNADAESTFSGVVKAVNEDFKDSQKIWREAYEKTVREIREAQKAESEAAAERKKDLDTQIGFFNQMENLAQTWVNLLATPWNMKPIFDDKTLKNMQEFSEIQNKYKQLVMGVGDEVGTHVAEARKTIQTEIDKLANYLLRKDLTSDLIKQAQALKEDYEIMLSTGTGVVIARADAEDKYDEVLKRQNSTLEQLVTNVTEADSLFSQFSNSQEKNRKKIESLVSSNEEYRDILKEVNKAESDIKSYQSFVDKMDKVIDKTDEGKESAAKLEVQMQLNKIQADKTALSMKMLAIEDALLADSQDGLVEELHSAAEAQGMVNTNFSNASPVITGLVKAYLEASNAIKNLDKVSGDMASKQDAYAKAVEAGALNTKNAVVQMYEDIAKGIKDNLSNVFENILSGQTKSFSNFFKDIKKMFIKWIAELAATAIANKITVPIVMSMNSALTPFGMGASNSQMGNMFNSMGMANQFKSYMSGSEGLGGSIADSFMSGVQNAGSWLGIGGSVGSAAGSALEAELFMSAPFEAISAAGVAGSGVMGTLGTVAAAIPVVGQVAAAVAAIASLAGLFKDKPDNMWYRLGSGDLGPAGTKTGNTTVNAKDLGDALFSANGPFGKIFISGWEDISGDIQNEFAKTMVTAIQASDTAISQTLGTALTEAGKAAIDGWLYQSKSWVETKDPQNYVDDVLVERYAALFSGIDSALGQAFIGLQDTTTATAEQVLTNAAAVATYAKVMDDTGLSAEELYSKVKDMGTSLKDGAASVATTASIYGELSRQSKITGKDLTKLTKYFDIFGGATVENAAKILKLNNVAESYGTTLETMIYAGDQFYGSQAANLESLANAAATNNPIYEQLIANLIASGDASKYTAEEAINMANVITIVNDSQRVLGLTEYDLSEAGYKAAKATSEAAGGLDKLTAWSNFYYENLLTTDQKVQQIINSFISKYPEMYKVIPDSALQSEEALRSWSVTAIEVARAAGFSEEQIAGFFTSLWDGWKKIQGLASNNTNNIGSYGDGGSYSSGYGSNFDRSAWISERANDLFGVTNTVVDAIVSAYTAAGMNVQDQLKAANRKLFSDAEDMRDTLINDYLNQQGWSLDQQGNVIGGNQPYYNGQYATDENGNITGWTHYTPTYQVMTAEEWKNITSKPIDALAGLTNDIASNYVKNLLAVMNKNKDKIDELDRYADRYGQENAQAMYDFVQRRNDSLRIITENVLDQAVPEGLRGQGKGKDVFTATDINTTISNWWRNIDVTKNQALQGFIDHLKTSFGDVFGNILDQVIDPSTIGDVFKNVHTEGVDAAGMPWSVDSPVLQDAQSIIGRTYQQLLDDGYFFSLPQGILDQMKQAALNGNAEYSEVLGLWDTAQQTLIDGFDNAGNGVKSSLEQLNEALQANNLTPILYTTNDIVSSISDSLSSTAASSEDTAEDIAKNIIKLFGTIDDAVSAINKYGDFVLTDEEKNGLSKDKARDAVNRFNNTLGLTGDSAIDTAAELRDYVEGLDLSTQAGQDAFKAAMGLVDALDTLGDSAQETADAIKNAQSSQEDAKYLWMSDSDVLAGKLNDITDAFSEMGIALPTSRDAYRQLILAQDATTQSGRDMITFLLKWKDVFGDVSDTIANSVDILQRMLSGVNTAWEDYQAAYDKQTETLNDQISALQDTNSKIEEQISLHEDLRSSYSDVAKTIKETIQSLKGGDLSTLSPEQKLSEARKLFEEAYAQTLSGTDEEKLAAYEKLSGYSEDYLNAARDYFASNTEYASIFNEVIAKLTASENAAGNKANAEQQIIDSLNASLKSNETQIALLQSQLDTMESQYNTMKDLYDTIVNGQHTTLTLAQAITNLTNAMSNYNAVSNMSEQERAWYQLYQDALGRAPDAAGLNYWITRQNQEGVGISDLYNEFINAAVDSHETLTLYGRELYDAAKNHVETIKALVDIKDAVSEDSGIIEYLDTMKNSDGGLNVHVMNGQSIGDANSTNYLDKIEVNTFNTNAGVWAIKDFIPGMNNFLSLIDKNTFNTNAGVWAIRTLLDSINHYAYTDSMNTTAIKDSIGSRNYYLDKIEVNTANTNAGVWSNKNLLDGLNALAANTLLATRSTDAGAWATYNRLGPISDSLVSINGGIWAVYSKLGSLSSSSTTNSGAYNSGPSVPGSGTTYGTTKPIEDPTSTVAPPLGTPKYAMGGLASGWSIVGEQGPELVNFTSPGRVYTANETSGMFQSATSNEEVIELLEEVLTELKAANQQRGQVAVAQIHQLNKIKIETEAQKRAIQRV